MKCFSHTPFNAANAPVLYSCPLNHLLLLFYFPFYFRIHWCSFLDLIYCFSLSTLYSFPLISSFNFFTFLLLFYFCSPFCSAELVWCQEEPKNMGAWTYVKPRFDTILREGEIRRKPIRHVCSVLVRISLYQYLYFFLSCFQTNSEEV